MSLFFSFVLVLFFCPFPFLFSLFVSLSLNFYLLSIVFCLLSSVLCLCLVFWSKSNLKIFHVHEWAAMKSRFCRLPFVLSRCVFVLSCLTFAGFNTSSPDPTGGFKLRENDYGVSYRIVSFHFPTFIAPQPCYRVVSDRIGSLAPWSQCSATLSLRAMRRPSSATVG